MSNKAFLTLETLLVWLNEKISLNKAFLTLETLLVWLNEKISTTAGVKYIFTLPEGNEIREVSQFVGGRSYVVSSVRKISHVPYGDDKQRFWPNRCVNNFVMIMKLFVLGTC